MEDRETNNDRPNAAAAQAASTENPARVAGLQSRQAIIDICHDGLYLMEAERLNQLTATLADLKARTTDLRRYL